MTTRIHYRTIKKFEVNREELLKKWSEGEKGHNMAKGAPRLVNIEGHYFDLPALEFYKPSCNWTKVSLYRDNEGRLC